jgi:hypothetical protein
MIKNIGHKVQKENHIPFRENSNKNLQNKIESLNLDKIKLQEKINELEMKNKSLNEENKNNIFISKKLNNGNLHLQKIIEKHDSKIFFNKYYKNKNKNLIKIK